MTRINIASDEPAKHEPSVGFVCASKPKRCFRGETSVATDRNR